jgi:hypothetical protein
MITGPTTVVLTFRVGSMRTEKARIPVKIVSTKNPCTIVVPDDYNKGRSFPRGRTRDAATFIGNGVKAFSK